MRTVWWYRASAVLLALFAIAHQLGFRQVDPTWGADAVVHGMQTVRFPVQGFQRTYWEFFSGFGFFSTAFLLFSAVIAFDLGRQSGDVLARLRLVRWAFAACYIVIAVLMFTNFFAAPMVLATLVAICLTVAAAVSRAPLNTRSTVEHYFEQLKAKGSWETSLADDVVFNNYASPAKEVRGKAAYLESTKRFYGSIQSMEVRQLTVDGDRAVALTRYQLRGPTGDFTSDVAEAFGVSNGKIDSFGIYFDTAPFPK
ncbi:MAG TPA: nuclear transport factor 2 family protein [Gemmatimonadaceae bacterium]|nr:nuclear transport factor 2 family protein [Gemmatimonadaceae bacterium]